MKLREIIDQTNFLIDDRLPDEWITGWVNDGLAEIGNEVNAVFPEMDVVEVKTEVPAIPNKWHRLLLIVFAAGRAKEQDSSQFEYADLYAQFEDNLADFKMQYTVPDRFREIEAGQELTLPNGSVVQTESGDTLYQLAFDNNVEVVDIQNENENIQFLHDYADMSMLDAPPFPWFNAF